MTAMTHADASTSAIARQRAGLAPNALAIHGAAMDRSVWTLLEAWLDEAGFGLNAVDLAGHGANDAPAPACIEAMADALAAGLEAAGTPPAPVIGHSMGALVAMELARRHPDRVLSLILLGVARPMTVNPDLIDLAERAPGEAAGLMARWAHAKSAPPTHAAATEAMVSRARPGVLASDLRACAAYEMDPAIAALRAMPVGLILGESDRMTPLAGGRALAGALGTGAVRELAFAGHMTMIDRPRETAEAVRALSAALALEPRE